MLVHEIMTSPVEAVDPETSIAEAARRMGDLDVGVLPVIHNDHLVGVLTDRDIVTRAVAQELPVNQEPVRSIMTGSVYTCYEDDDVEDAAEIMESRQIRRLFVQDDQGRVTGIISLGDIVVMTQDEQLAGAILERISEPVELGKKIA